AAWQEHRAECRGPRCDGRQRHGTRHARGLRPPGAALRPTRLTPDTDPGAGPRHTAHVGGDMPWILPGNTAYGPCGWRYAVRPGLVRRDPGELAAVVGRWCGLW